MRKIKHFFEIIEDNIIVRIAKVVLFIITILLLVVIGVQRFSNNNLSIGGFRVFMIVSESMKGEYEIGNILIEKSVPASDINIGDNITYLSESEGAKGITITHKVIKKEEREGTTYFVTKGIANAIEDPEITYDQVYGKVIYKTILLSFLGKLMSKPGSYYLLFILVGFIVSIEIVSSMFKSDDEEEEGNERREKEE